MRPALRFCSFLLLFLIVPAVYAQDTLSLATKGLKARSIGPAVMSGRIPDVAVYEKNPSYQYVASASGGVWKTTNHGTTWTPVFDQESTSAIGAIAVYQGNADIVWAGTGEANPRNSVSWGHGVFKSVDGGKSWKNMGLKDSHHIGRILIHPTNPDIIYVAAMGHFWGPNKERGLFKSINGGKSWEHCLALDENTGCIDVAMDPLDHQVLYACAYAVRRDGFSGGNPQKQTGPKAGMYKSTDGGATWQKLAKGLPTNLYGRCGVSVYRKNPNIVYAVVQTDKTTATVSGQAPNQKLDLAAGGIFRSDDKGETWRQVNSLVPRPFYYGQIRVDPSDDLRIYVLGIQFHMSNDGGKSFTKENFARGTHVDYHALWINPTAPNHLVLGCDGGLNYSFDRGLTWEHLKNLPISQFYAIGVDSRTPYRIYGGLQDNGSWGGPSATREPAGISTPDWTQILGYDGYYCQADPINPDIVFAEGQYGILNRINIRTLTSQLIKPRLDAKGTKSNINPNPEKSIPAIRFNWSSPILLSGGKGHPLYYGGNFLFRSDDKGNSWKILGPDLTRGKPGPSDYSGHTITTIAEVPDSGILFAGTDDGRVQVTRDGGSTWEDLSEKIPGVPQDRWISRLECSHSEKGVVYLTIDRHRNDDFKTYVYRSADLGQTWESIVNNVPPNEPAYVIKVDPRDPQRLFLGTEYGLYLSHNQGKTWTKYGGLPTVPVHDLTFADKDQDLVIGTHGRGIYILDVAPLRSLKVDEAAALHVRAGKVTRTRASRALGIKQFYGENPPSGVVLQVFFAKPPEMEPRLTITDKEGKTVREFKVPRDAGLHRVVWGFLVPKGGAKTTRPLTSGNYTAILRLGASTQIARDFTVETGELSELDRSFPRAFDEEGWEKED